SPAVSPALGAVAAAATVGRAHVPTVSPSEDPPAAMPAAPTMYRAGEVRSATPSALPRRGGDLPVRTPGQTRIGDESPWSAFAKSWQEPPPAAPVAEPASEAPEEPGPSASPVDQPAEVPAPAAAEVPAPAAPALPPEVVAEVAEASRPRAIDPLNDPLPLVESPASAEPVPAVPRLAQRVPGATVNENPPVPIPAAPGVAR